MLTVMRYTKPDETELRTVVRVGSEAECIATKDAVTEVLERMGIAVGEPAPGDGRATLFLEVAVDDTADETIVEGNEVEASSSIVVKAATQIAAGV